MRNVSVLVLFVGFAALSFPFGQCLAGSSSLDREVNAPHQQPYRLLWRQQLMRTGFHRDIGLAFGEPEFVRGKNLVVVAAPNGRVQALRAQTGKLMWELDLGVELSGIVKHAKDNERELLLVADRLGYLHGLSLTGQEVLWRVKIGAAITNLWPESQTTTYLTTDDHRFIAVSTANGLQLWEHKRSGVPVMTIRGAGRPLVEGDRVYLGFADGHVAALNKSSGKVIWTRDLSVGMSGRFRDSDFAPLRAPCGILFANYQAGLFCLEREHGGVEFRVNAKGITYFESTPQTLIAGTHEGKVFAISWETRKKKYYSDLRIGPVLGSNETGLSDTAVLAAANSLTLIRRETGRPIQAFKLPGEILNSPVVSGDFIGLIDSGGELLVFSR